MNRIFFRGFLGVIAGWTDGRTDADGRRLQVERDCVLARSDGRAEGEGMKKKKSPTQEHR